MKNLSGLAGLLALSAALVACGSRPVTKAPVEDRTPQRGLSSGRAVTPVAPAPAAQATSAEPAKPLRGLENAGKPGYYTVQRGDTLIRIALDNGQNWRDIARWNSLDNPNVIEVGEVLRVLPPPGDAVVARPITSGGATPAPLPAPGGRPAQPASPAPAPSAASAPPANAQPANAQPASGQAAAPSADEEMAWVWPARGNVVGSFDEAKNKGLDIAGKAGDAVLAAADGRVVYAGSGLRGYGNLVILKHNNTFLTAYAHNQSLLVKEDQMVKQGQKIAEMGSTDADRVKLHFEIRRNGKPVDPARFLPAR